MDTTVILAQPRVSRLRVAQNEAIGRAPFGLGSPCRLPFRIPLLGPQKGPRSMSILLPVWCEKVPYDIWDLAAQIEVLLYINLIPWSTVGCSCPMLIRSPCGYSLRGKKRTWLPNRHPGHRFVEKQVFLCAWCLYWWSTGAISHPGLFRFFPRTETKGWHCLLPEQGQGQGQG